MTGEISITTGVLFKDNEFHRTHTESKNFRFLFCLFLRLILYTITFLSVSRKQRKTISYLLSRFFCLSTTCIVNIVSPRVVHCRPCELNLLNFCQIISLINVSKLVRTPFNTPYYQGKWETGLYYSLPFHWPCILVILDTPLPVHSQRPRKPVTCPCVVRVSLTSLC